MSEKHKFLLLGVVLPAALIALQWLLFADSYNFTYYKLPGCHKTLTVLVISGSEDRRIAFIPYEYHERRLPTYDYVLAALGSGLGGAMIA